MLHKIIDPISDLKIDHLEFDLTLTTFTFYNTHILFLDYNFRILIAAPQEGCNV